MTAPPIRGAAARSRPTPGERLDRALSRAGATGLLARDALLAGVVAALTLGMYAFLAQVAPADESLGVTAAEVWAMAAVATAQALLLCLRRFRPVACFAVIAALQLAVIAIAPSITAQSMAAAVAAYTVGTAATVRFALAACATAALAEAVASAWATWGLGNAPLLVLNQTASSLVLYAAAAFIGSYMATRRRNALLSAERAAEVLRAHRQRSAAAVAAERTRIARELHDVAAHHLSGMVIQAAAVERLIARDPEAARSGAASIRSQGKETLANLRQVVGLLRDSGDGGDGNAPIPGVEALDALVDESRRLGDDIAFTREGPPLRLPPIADISFYRIAQQALTNARQHAPGAPVDLRLVYGEHHVHLAVVNGPAREEPPEIGNGGTGLVGMRERADLVGADLEAGPTADGGWAVRLHLVVRESDRERREVAGSSADTAGTVGDGSGAGVAPTTETGESR